MPDSTVQAKRTRTQKQQAEWERCAADPVYWLNTYGRTYDPRIPATVPFHLWPIQESYLAWLKKREECQESGLVEKSRDMGVSYLCCGYALHGWLFRSGFSAGFGSRKLELVDKIGDPDSLFEKLRILLRGLPDWMLPIGFDWKRHDNFAKLINPESGSTITGEGGDEIGRGGRKTLYFVDECAFLEHPDLTERSLSATTNCRIDVSTPNGPGNAFARKRHSGKVAVFTFHYRDDPRMTPEVIARKRAESDKVSWAQEREIDYSASIEGICIPAEWVRACVDFVIKGLSKDYPMVAGFDVADGGKNKSVFIARRGPIVLDPLDWEEISSTQAAWMAADEAERLGVKSVFYDCIGVGSSVKGAWENSERVLQFRTHAIKWGDAPSNAHWPNGKSSQEIFANLRAELWWVLRTRCEKTYQVVTEGAQFPPDELISLPNCPELIAQLSLPLYHYTNTGKIQLESKQDMQKRGVSSPDYGDALAYSESSGNSVSYGPSPYN